MQNPSAVLKLLYGISPQTIAHDIEVGRINFHRLGEEIVEIVKRHTGRKRAACDDAELLHKQLIRGEDISRDGESRRR